MVEMGMTESSVSYYTINQMRRNTGRIVENHCTKKYVVLQTEKICFQHGCWNDGEG